MISYMTAKIRRYLSGRQTKVWNIHKKFKAVYKCLEQIEEETPSDVQFYCELEPWHQWMRDMKQNLGELDRDLQEHLADVRELERRYFDD